MVHRPRPSVRRITPMVGTTGFHRLCTVCMSGLGRPNIVDIGRVRHMVSLLQIPCEIRLSQLLPQPALKPLDENSLTVLIFEEQLIAVCDNALSVGIQRTVEVVVRRTSLVEISITSLCGRRLRPMPLAPSAYPSITAKLTRVFTSPLRLSAVTFATLIGRLLILTDKTAVRAINDMNAYLYPNGILCP